MCFTHTGKSLNVNLRFQSISYHFAELNKLITIAQSVHPYRLSLRNHVDLNLQTKIFYKYIFEDVFISYFLTSSLCSIQCEDSRWSLKKKLNSLHARDQWYWNIQTIDTVSVSIWIDYIDVYIRLRRIQWVTPLNGWKRTC